jgi:NADH:ubiquinone oxidoreductase subunit
LAGLERTPVLKWLRGNTLGTYLTTRFRGEAVGEDEFGNRYYRTRGAKDPSLERRWVVYAGDAEADGSLVPPGWHGWLNRSREKPPSEDPLPTKRWEKQHQPNLSGSPAAYVPPGHDRRGGQRAPATGDYEAWRP